MAQTLLRGEQVTDGSIKRDDLNVSTAGQAVIRKVIAGTNISLTYTGTDSGTGDVTINATGGGAPGGTSSHIQYNDGAGGFAGSGNFTWQEGTKKLELNGANTGIRMLASTTSRDSIAADYSELFSWKVAERIVPRIKGAKGHVHDMGIAEWSAMKFTWFPTTATAGLWTGTAGAGAGTYTTALPTTTNAYTSHKRGRWANVVTTANQVLGQRNTEAMFFRGNADNRGGFFFYARIGFDVWTNGGRLFGGLHSGTSVISANPSSLNNTVGFCVDSGDAGLIHFLTRGTAATKVSTGMTIANNGGYELFIFCEPNSSEIHWKIVDINTGAEASGTAVDTLPTNTTMLTAGVLASNAALTAATAIQLGISKIHVESNNLYYISGF